MHYTAPLKIENDPLGKLNTADTIMCTFSSCRKDQLIVNNWRLLSYL